MRTKLAEVNPTAGEMLSPSKNDRSGVGVHYVDAYLKPIKSLTLEDGRKFTAKRRGLKVTLSLGDKKGDGLMRRLEVSRDPVIMLEHALKEASAKLGISLHTENGFHFLEESENASV
jgi:hypothetical protein